MMMAMMMMRRRSIFLCVRFAELINPAECEKFKLHSKVSGGQNNSSVAAFENSSHFVNMLIADADVNMLMMIQNSPFVKCNSSAGCTRL